MARLFFTPQLARFTTVPRVETDEATLRAGHGLVAFSLYYIAGAAGTGWIASLLNAVKNPIVASLMLGLACNALGVALPQVVLKIFSMLSAAARPAGAGCIAGQVPRAQLA